MTKKIRWGILGTGKIAVDFGLALQLVKDAELQAIASRNVKKAKQFAKNLGAARYFDNYDDLVADPNIDIVYIATPNALHKEHSLLALNAGKPVLCEKPFALTADEAQTVIDVARSKGLFCMEAMWIRFIPAMQAVKQCVTKGEIGDINLLIADMGYPASASSHRSLFNPQGGGVLLDRGIYLISLAYFLLGKPDGIVSQARLNAQGIDEQISILLNYKSGAQANLAATFKTYK